MDRLALVAVLALAAVAVAALLRRRAAAAHGLAVPGAQGWSLPGHLDRADFARPDAPWLVAVFTSATCDSCATTIDKARVLDSAEVAVVDVEFGEHRDLHAKYGIEAVPAIAVTDDEGGVRRWLLGPAPAAELWAAVAEIRAEDEIGAVDEGGPEDEAGPAAPSD